MASADRPPELLEAVIAADRDIWAEGRPGSLQRRNEAVASALAAGWSHDELAEALQVNVDDVVSWARPRPEAEQLRDRG